MDTSPPTDKKSRSVPVLPIVIAVLFGALLGHFAPNVAVKTKIIGIIFLNLLFVLVIPLIVSSMITGVAGLGDIRHVGSIGLRTIVYYLSTTFFAVMLGIILVNITNPGKGRSHISGDYPGITYTITPTPISGGSLLAFGGETAVTEDINPKRHVVRLIDQNLSGVIDPEGIHTSREISIVKWLDDSGTKREPAARGQGLSFEVQVNRLTGSELLSNFVPRNIIGSMVEENIFPLILFSLVFGGVLSTIGIAGEPLMAVFNAVNLTVIKCVVLLMYLAPLGIFGLTAGSIGEAELTLPGGFIAEMLRLARYTGTVIAGLLLHALITLPLILAFIGKRKPFTFMCNIIPALLTAFSTGSSMATLPVSITYVTEKNKVSERIADFVLPIGATVNMDGTALYQIVAAVFIAQIYDIPLGLPALAIMVLTATIGSIGAAAIPQAGLVTLVVVLRSVGIPVEGIGAILSIDWFIDRCRTTVNVWGDLIGSAVIDHYESGENLK